MIICYPIAVILSTCYSELGPFCDLMAEPFKLLVSAAYVITLFVSLFTQAEVNLVLEHGVPPENIILTGVCKQLAHIKHAAKNNIQHLVCDSEAELSKISRLYPSAK